MKVDSLLQYLPDNPDQFECWIGLNDIATEAGSDADAFVWVDGTNHGWVQFLNGLEIYVENPNPIQNWNGT